MDAITPLNIIQKIGKTLSDKYPQLNIGDIIQNISSENNTPEAVRSDIHLFHEKWESVKVNLSESQLKEIRQDITTITDNEKQSRLGNVAALGGDELLTGIIETNIESHASDTATSLPVEDLADIATNIDASDNGIIDCFLSAIFSDLSF
jgi:hypothetical protein